PTCPVEASVAALKFLLLAAAVGYLGVTALVWLAQERLLFYPQPVAPPPVAPPGWRIEEVELRSRDGTRLVGVMVVPPVARPGLVIYFGGNAQEATSFAPSAMATYGERAALLVNYRGYGASEGRPGEASLVSDGIELFDWARRRGDIDASRIALHGTSLGTGVAVQVAAARPARCVVLTSPFASALDLAREIYPWLPVAWLLRHPFDSAARAPQLRMPALFLMGNVDTLIAPRHSQRLAALWGGPAERVTFEGFGHNDIALNPRYAATIREFLDRND
ncbi:MAG: alpha/beta hydrolase, partial [Usitatibacter sp.]